MHEGIQGESFPTLLERRAAVEEFIKWFRASDLPEKLSATEWAEQVLPVLRAVDDLGWMKSSDREWIQARILDFALQAFTKVWNPREHSFGAVPEA